MNENHFRHEQVTQINDNFLNESGFVDSHI